VLPDAHDPMEEKSPHFQTFVTWAFYALIVLLGYLALGKFDHIDENFTSVRIEISSMNIKLAQILEHQSFSDKEVQDLRDEVKELRRHVIPKNLK
jgi:hypothetical protein